MSIKKINIGNIVNDGLGDDLRTAFQKVNNNFSDLSEQLASIDFSLEIKNLGSGARVVKEHGKNTINFRSIISGRHILVDELPDSVQIVNTAPTAFYKIDTDLGSIEARNFQEISIRGGDNVNVTAIDSTITVDTIKINNDSFKDILNNFDFGPITGNFKNAVQFAVAASNVDFGTFNLPGSFNLDFGKIT